MATGPTVKSTTTTQLSPEAQAAANAAFPQLQQWMNSNIQLPGQTTVGFNPLEQQGQQSILDAGQRGGALAQQSANSLGFLLDPSMLDPNSNPYLRASGDAVARTMSDQLNQQILPGLRSGATMQNGMYGGGASKEGQQIGTAVGDTAMATGDILNQMYSNAYQTGLGTMLGANSQVGANQVAQLFPGMMQSQVGAQNRSMAQQQLDDQNNRDMLTQMMPLLKAQQIYGMIPGMPGSSTVTTSTGAVPGGASGMQRALGGAATGASLGSMVPGIGTGIGALLGGAGGYFFG